MLRAIYAGFEAYSFSNNQLIAQCIDKYIALRNQDSGEEIDPRLQNVVERMFQRCIDDGEYKQAIGIALESKRLDVIEDVISKGNPHELLAFVVEVSMTLVQNLQFRNQVHFLKSIMKDYLATITELGIIGFAITCKVIQQLGRT